MALLIVSAEAGELKPFANQLTGVRKLKWPLDYAVEGILRGRRMLLVANGAGPKLASQAVEVALRAMAAAELSASKLEAIASVGYCGATTSAGQEGQIIVATEVLDLADGTRLPCLAPQTQSSYLSGIIASQNSIASHNSEKHYLAQTGAIAVEMEAVGVAVRTKRAGLPFLCIKVVTDRADESFALDLNTMRTSEGRIARGKIGIYALMHPGLIPELLRWKRRAEDGAKVLGDFLVSCQINFAGEQAVVE